MKFKKLTGVDAMQRRIRKIADAWPEDVEHAMREETKAILREDVSPHVPRDTNELVDSGHVVVETKGKTTTAAIVFDAPHARIVHEDFEAKHDDGEAKFLERPINAVAPSFPRRIVRRIDLKKMTR